MAHIPTLPTSEMARLIANRAHAAAESWMEGGVVIAATLGGKARRRKWPFISALKNGLNHARDLDFLDGHNPAQTFQRALDLRVHGEILAQENIHLTGKIGMHQA